MLTIKQFREYLNQFPDDMEIVETRCSDMGPMDISNWYKVWGINEVRNINPRNPNSETYEWIQHVQRPEQLSDVNKLKVKEFLHYAGN